MRRVGSSIRGNQFTHDEIIHSQEEQGKYDFYQRRHNTPILVAREV